MSTLFFFGCSRLPGERTARTDVLQSLVILEFHVRSGFMNISTLCRHGREYDVFLLEFVLK